MNAHLSLGSNGLSAVVIIAVFTITCGREPTPENPRADSPDMSAADAAPDAGPTVMCPVEGNLFCGEKCIDVTFDLDHCGACGNQCTRGKMTCMAGECLCLGSAIMCEGACYDGFTSREHCGSCGEACTIAEACVSGACRPIADDPNIYGVLVATNEARARQQDCGVHGLRPAVGPVRLNDLLTSAAQSHAIDMSTNMFFEHEGSDGASPGDRAARAGYAGSTTGENIARGQANAEAVVASWIDSDGHCKNLMNGAFDELGVGYATSGPTGQPYWVQLFGSQ